MSNLVQDWEPVVLQRKKPKNTDNENTVIAPRNVPLNKPKPEGSKQLLHDFDPDHVSKPLVSNRDLALALQKARIAKIDADGKPMTQGQLDKACNLPTNTIRDYEACKAVVSSQQLLTIERFLKVHLPRPPKQHVKSSE